MAVLLVYLRSLLRLLILKEKSAYPKAVKSIAQPSELHVSLHTSKTK